jgi:hypothetical protein
MFAPNETVWEPGAKEIICTELECLGTGWFTNRDYCRCLSFQNVALYMLIIRVINSKGAENTDIIIILLPPGEERKSK